MKPETQEFLENLTDEDITRIKKALRTYVVVETLGWFLRWAAISVLAIAVAISQFGDSIKKIIDWTR